MKSLIGHLSSLVIDDIDKTTKLRFKNPDDFVTPDALIISEQKLLNEDTLLNLCNAEYQNKGGSYRNVILQVPKVTYVPNEIVDFFYNYRVVVLDYNVDENTVVLGTIPEFMNDKIIIDKYQIKRVAIPIYSYISLYTKQYGEPSFLAKLPILDLLHFIYREALTKKASDITISTTSQGANIYYNIRKNKVYSKRHIEKEDVDVIANSLAVGAGSAMDLTTADAKPRFFSIDIDKHNRGRVVINKTYYGRLITIRVLPNEVLTSKVEDLNLNKGTCDFIRNHFISKEKGLRLFIGETMSGKNTSILASLNELVSEDRYKIVSVEQPVEILVDGIEQINAETDEEFEKNADSLLRQNPDFVYFTEITARTAPSIMQQANTAKAVFSSLHANSISDVPFRLQDITHMELDRLILTLHSCIYQELVRVEELDRVFPYTRCVYFSDELKMKLYGQNIATIKTILQEEERKWEEKYNSVNRGLVLNKEVII